MAVKQWNRRRIAAAAAIVVGIVGISVAVFILTLIWRAGSFKTIDPHFAGVCRLVEGPIGPEDITIDQRRGVAFVSANGRRGPGSGAIFSYDLESPEARPVNLTPDADSSFRPHGISLWTGEDGKQVLYVINHPGSGSGPVVHSIEIFDIEDGGLRHRASLTDPRLVMPNDLVAVGLDRFYVTNTHAHPPGPMQTIETYLQLSGANALFYGPGGFRPAVENLVFPNGINTSADGRTIYVATVTPRELLVFDRDPASEALALRERVLLGSGADNIEVDAQGSLWIGAHPKLLDTAAYGGDTTRLAPSQVLRVTAAPGGGFAVDEIYLNRGDEISGSSVAARRGKRLLIGQFAGSGFLDCVMD